LIFNHGGTVWGLPIGNVSEVIVEPELFPIPKPINTVLGLVVYRGQPAVAISLEETTDKAFGYGIVVRALGRYKVLLNNEPGLLMDVDASDLSVYDDKYAFVRAAIKTNTEDILIIDPRRILKANQ